MPDRHNGGVSPEVFERGSNQGLTASSFMFVHAGLATILAIWAHSWLIRKLRESAHFGARAEHVSENRHGHISAHAASENSIWKSHETRAGCRLLDEFATS